MSALHPYALCLCALCLVGKTYQKVRPQFIEAAFYQRSLAGKLLFSLPTTAAQQRVQGFPGEGAATARIPANNSLYEMRDLLDTHCCTEVSQDVGLHLQDGACTQAWPLS